MSFNLSLSFTPSLPFLNRRSNNEIRMRMHQRRTRLAQKLFTTLAKEERLHLSHSHKSISGSK